MPFLKVLLSVSMIGLLVFKSPACQAVEKPNVILIYTDDQGSIDLNCYGAKDLITPQLDKLAKSGTRFTQFYSAAPVCSPSRAAVITGRYPQRAGLAGNASSKSGGSGMPTDEITMAEIFKSAGYKTAHIGKWHLGYTPDQMPNGQGFDYSFGHMGGCIDNYSHFFYWNGPNRHDLFQNGKEIWRDGEFFPDLMVTEAKQFMKKNKKDPFFMYWAINVPHYPLQGTDKWRKKYSHLDSPRDMYAAFVSTMDEMIGAVIDCVDDLGIRDNTIIVFQSDHGHSQEERTFGGGGSSGPYRGAKFSLFEGGIRVPAIISWPGEVPANQVRSQFATAVDWLPTVASMAGIDTPAERVLDGHDLTDVIYDNADAPVDTFYWQSGRGLGGKPQWAVRHGNWKLIGNPKDTSNKAPITAKDAMFLVDLSEDVAEMRNVAAKNPEVVEQLRKMHEAWLTDVSKPRGTTDE